MNKFKTVQSDNLFKDLKQYLVDGVSSSFHKSPLESYPISMSYGKGSKIYDIDGNEYIDYVGGFGPLILGHSPDAINNAVIDQVKKGSQFSSPTKALCELSKILTEIIPCAEMVSFQNTGTEAVMHAFRLARAYTGKSKIIKFEGHYHGWSDEEKISIDAEYVSELGPIVKPYKLLGSFGQNDFSANNIIVLPWNNLEAVEECLKRNGNEVAGLIMEPFMCDSGPIYPLEGYLAGIRELTKRYNVVLIFDEVITGFRLALGGAQEYFNVTPDLSTFAKAIAGGYPLAAICGKRSIMQCGVHSSGTFNANPISVAASIATIRELQQPNVYKKFEDLGNLLVDNLLLLAKKYKIKLYAKAVRSICILEFGFQTDKPLIDLRDCISRNDYSTYNKFFLLAKDYGIRLTSKRGRIYLSTAHTQEDIENTIKVFDFIFSQL